MKIRKVISHEHLFLKNYKVNIKVIKVHVTNIELFMLNIFSNRIKILNHVLRMLHGTRLAKDEVVVLTWWNILAQLQIVGLIFHLHLALISLKYWFDGSVGQPWKKCVKYISHLCCWLMTDSKFDRFAITLF